MTTRRRDLAGTAADAATVHVITDLGPTNGPGFLVQAQLLPRDPLQDLRDQSRRVQEQLGEQLGEAIRRQFHADTFAGHAPGTDRRHRDTNSNPFMRPRRKR